MKKFVKMSLVAALAVSAANAGALEEAIKNVDVSGKVYVETLATTPNNGSTSTTTDLDADITFSSKVNDNVTAVVRVQADREESETEWFKGSNDVTMDNIYFTYANGPLSVSAGKMDMNTPNTDGELGNGIQGSYAVNGNLTLAAAYFYDHEIGAGTNLTLGQLAQDVYNGATEVEDYLPYLPTEELYGSDISVVAALGNVGAINFELWYVNLAGDHLTAVVSSAIEGVKLSARYANSDLDNGDEGTTIRLDASTSVNGVNLKAMYLTTDEDGAATVTDPSSANTYELTQLADNSTNPDTNVYALGASYTMNTMTYFVDYADLETKNGVEEDELRLRATYKMSSNFNVTATYSMLDSTAGDKNSARLEAKYSF